MSLHSNPTVFWKSLRPGKSTLPTDIKTNDFFVYLKSISNPKTLFMKLTMIFLRIYVLNNTDNFRLSMTS